MDEREIKNEIKICNDFLSWIKSTQLHLFINEYIKVILKYLYSPHYEHYYDDNPYDHSGELRNTYSLNIDNINNISDLLNCYLGYWMPTYISYYGKHYITVMDEAHTAISCLYTSILYKYVIENPDIFNIKESKELTEDDIFEIIDENFDYLWLYDFDVIEMVEKILDIKQSI